MLKTELESWLVEPNSFFSHFCIIVLIQLLYCNLFAITLHNITLVDQFLWKTVSSSCIPSVRIQKMMPWWIRDFLEGVEVSTPKGLFDQISPWKLHENESGNSVNFHWRFVRNYKTQIMLWRKYFPNLIFFTTDLFTKAYCSRILGSKTPDSTRIPKVKPHFWSVHYEPLNSNYPKECEYVMEFLLCVVDVLIYKAFRDKCWNTITVSNSFTHWTFVLVAQMLGWCFKLTQVNNDLDLYVFTIRKWS